MLKVLLLFICLILLFVFQTFTLFCFSVLKCLAAHEISATSYGEFEFSWWAEARNN